MGRSVLELAVGTGKWNSGLKDAQKALNNFTSSQGGFNQALQKNSESMVKFIGMMGKVDSTANTSRGQLRDYKNSLEQLTLVYDKLSETDKKGEPGKVLSATLDSLKEKIRATKEQMEALNREIESSGSASSKLDGGGGGFGDMLNGIGGKFGLSKSAFTLAGATVAGAGLAYKLVGDNVATAMNFEKSISQLSSLTGKTGEELEQLKNYAIDLGSTTTLSASQVADAFKMIGSQQPQLLESGEALRDVTKAAITLSEAAGIDLATASQSLSTSINQFGGDSTQAERFVNVLAAASQKGAGDISYLGEAISKSGVLANAVGTSYEELVANLEQLAAAGMDASTSGTALRSIIANLEKQSNNEYKPSVVGLTQAFQNLGDAHLSTVDYVNIAGKQFFSQAMILADNAEKAKQLTKEITGTNTAEEQAKTNTDNLDGSLKSLASAWEGLGLHINSSNGLLKTFVDALKDVITWADRTFTSLGRVQKKQAEINAQRGSDGNNKVDTDLAKLRDQNYYKSTYGVLLGQYDAEIRKRETSIANIQREHIGKGTVNTSRLEEELQAWKNLRQEFVSRASSAMKAATSSIQEDASTTPSSASSSTTGNTGKKGGRGSGAHKTTPAEKAEQMVDSALQSYAQSITEADLRMQAGLDTSLDHKKKELAAQQRLFEAYGKAYAIYSDPKYKKAYDDAAMQYQKLAEEVKNAKDPNVPEGSLKGLNDKLKELQKQRELLTDPIEIQINDKKIDDLKERIKELSDGDIFKYNLRVQEDELTAKLDELEKKRKKLEDPMSIRVVNDDIKKVQAQIEEVKVKAVETKVDVDTTDIDKALASLRQLTDTPDKQVNVKVVAETVGNVQGMLDGLKDKTVKAGVQVDTTDITKALEELRQLANVPDAQVSVTVMGDAITKVQGMLDGLKDKAIKAGVDVDTTDIDKALASLRQLTDTPDKQVNVKVVAETVGNIQGILDSFKDKTAKAGVEVDTTGIEKALSGLKQMADAPDAQVDVKIVGDAITKVQGMLDGLKDKTLEASVKADTTELDAELAKLYELRDLLKDPLSIDVVVNDIEDVEKQLEDLRKMRDVEDKPKPEPLTLEQKVRYKIAEERENADTNAMTNLLKVQLEHDLKGIDIDTNYLQEAIFGEGMDIPDKYWQDLTDQINAKLKELGIEPITIDVKTGNITQGAKKMKEGWQDAAQAVQSVGNALQQIEDPGAKIAGLVGQAIANIALGFAQATTAASTGGPFAWIAAIAGGMATMVSTISAIHSVTGYSEGGIIKGHSYSGDNIMANGGTIGLNAGEIVLNRAQAGNLASQLSGGLDNLHLETSISAERFRIMLNTNSKRHGHGEYVTTR